VNQDFRFNCPTCNMKASNLSWEMLPNEKGEFVNTPFLEYDYCIMSPFNKQNNETGKASWKRCKRNVLLIKDFNWDEWNKLKGL